MSRLIELKHAASDVEMAVACLQDARSKLYGDQWLEHEVDTALEQATTTLSSVRYTINHPEG